MTETPFKMLPPPTLAQIGLLIILNSIDLSLHQLTCIDPSINTPDQTLLLLHCR